MSVEHDIDIQPKIEIPPKQLYSCYDKKANTWVNPLVHTSRPEAIRAFTQIINEENENSLIYRYPEDYDFWLIGYWDDVNGIVIPDKVLIGNGLDFKEQSV